MGAAFRVARLPYGGGSCEGARPDPVVVQAPSRPRLQDTLGCAYLFITHDLAVVKEFAARTLVLQPGRIVEEGRSVDVCDRPRHEYTRRLVAAVPDPDLQRVRRQQRLGVGVTA